MLRKNDTPEDCQTAIAVLDSKVYDQKEKIEGVTAYSAEVGAGKVIGYGLIAVAYAISAIAFAILNVGLLWVKHRKD